MIIKIIFKEDKITMLYIWMIKHMGVIILILDMLEWIHHLQNLIFFKLIILQTILYPDCRIFNFQVLGINFIYIIETIFGLKKSAKIK